MTRPQFKSGNGNVFLAAALAPVLASCGVDPARLPDAVTRLAKADAVVLATQAQIEHTDVVAGSYMVAFRAPLGATRSGYASFLAESRTHDAWLTERFAVDPRVKDVRFITSVDLANPGDPAVARDLDPPSALRLAWGEPDLDEVPAALTVVEFQNADVAPEVLKEWEAAGEIWFAEPNYVNRLLDNPYTQEMATNYASAAIWWHTAIKLDKALTKLAGSTTASTSTPVIAVLDSGLDVEHVAIKDHLWVNEKPGQSGCPGDLNGCDTTVAKKGVFGSGFVHPYAATGYGVPCPHQGEAIKLGSKEDSDRGVCQHGTHVAGIIAATLGAGIGGVCPVCKIMPIRIIQSINGLGAASDAAIVTGFKYLTNFRGTGGKVVRIANSSFGKYQRARAVSLLVNVLKKAPNEVLVVGAAGNEDSMARSYPAALNDAIAVAAVGPANEKATYSNFGPWVDVSAPGGNYPASRITSSVPGGEQDDKQGTSMAAPVVAGVAGLILSIDPGRSFSKLRASIIDSADCIIYDASVDGGKNRNYYSPKIEGESARQPLLGSGLLDAEAALDGLNKSDCRGAKLRRVNRGCGTVGGALVSSPTSRPSGGLFMMVLGLPAMLVFLGSGKRPSRKGRRCSV